MEVWTVTITIGHSGYETVAIYIDREDAKRHAVKLQKLINTDAVLVGYGRYHLVPTHDNYAINRYNPHTEIAQ